MPTDDKTDIGLLYLKDFEKDEWVSVPNVLQNIINDSDPGTKRADLFFWKQPIQLKMNIHQKQKISRKKFKKWLMSTGFSRDVSEWLCWYVGVFQGAVARKDIYQLFTNPVTPIVFDGSFTPIDIFTAIAVKGATEWKTNK